MRPHLLPLLLGMLLFGAASAEDPPRSPASDTPRSGVIRSPLPSEPSEGLPLALVFYDLVGASGLTGGDAEARRQIERSVALTAGTAFNAQTTALALQRVRALPFVRAASSRLYESDRAGFVVLVLSIELGRADARRGPSGVLAGHIRDFPALHQSESALLRLQLDGGLGFYLDGHPWFGETPAFTARSPVAVDPADGSTATWGEASVEYGLAGITRLGRSAFWLYGAGTFLTSASIGQDLFRADTRELTKLEDLYAGLVVGTPVSDWSANLSAGRQNWQLQDGFLFSRFAAGANAGPHPGLYLNPRTAYEMTGLATVRWKQVSLQGFYVDPAELDFLDSDSAWTGATLAWSRPQGLEASLLWYQAVDGRTVFAAPTGPVPREGLRTLDLRLGTTSLLDVPGLELFGEHAWQTHRATDVAARAYYLRTGYTFARLPWKPNLSYRYASFSGDDPDTDTFERFDAPLSSGLDTWVQGVSAKKVVPNGNLDSHRLRINLAPRDRLSLTFDYFWLQADAGTGPSNYGQEINLALRWSLSPRLFLLGVAGIAWPGDRLRDQAGGDPAPWTTVQTSLFFNF
jgi:hypothetical protein